MELSWTNILVLLVLTFFASAGLTRVLWRHALRKQWLVVPTDRSSHTTSTPTGAGVVIATVLLLTISALGAVSVLDHAVAWALVGGGIMVAVVGWIDIHHPLKVRWRILVHTMAAAWALWFLGGVPEFNLGVAKITLGVGGVIGGLLWIVGLSNFYNFMDGIDGLVGTEAVMVGGVGGAMLASAGALGLALVAWGLAASAGSFLLWNWHPAKIFMGDVGSVFLGFIFAVLALASENAGVLPWLVWVVLLSVIIVDAGLSTVRRALRGERWFEAHRTFGYHRLVERGYSHSLVTLMIGGVNVILVLIAVLVWRFPPLLLPATVGSFAGVGLLWWWLQRGAVVRSRAHGDPHIV